MTFQSGRSSCRPPPAFRHGRRLDWISVAEPSVPESSSAICAVQQAAAGLCFRHSFRRRLQQAAAGLLHWGQHPHECTAHSLAGKARQAGRRRGQRGDYYMQHSNGAFQRCLPRVPPAGMHRGPTMCLHHLALPLNEFRSRFWLLAHCTCTPYPVSSIPASLSAVPNRGLRAVAGPALAVGHSCAGWALYVTLGSCPETIERLAGHSTSGGCCWLWHRSRWPSCCLGTRGRLCAGPRLAGGGSSPRGRRLHGGGPGRVAQQACVEDACREGAAGIQSNIPNTDALPTQRQHATHPHPSRSPPPPSPPTRAPTQEQPHIHTHL